MLTYVQYFSVNLKVHKMWHSSMNRKWRNRILKKYHFFQILVQTALLRVPAILTSLTRHCWVNKQWCLVKKIKFLLKFWIRKGPWVEIVYQRVYKQKLVSVICKAVADDDWPNGTVDHKLMAANRFALRFRAKQLLRKYGDCSHNSIHMIFRW